MEVCHVRFAHADARLTLPSRETPSRELFWQDSGAAKTTLVRSTCRLVQTPRRRGVEANRLSDSSKSSASANSAPPRDDLPEGSSCRALGTQRRTAVLDRKSTSVQYMTLLAR